MALKIACLLIITPEVETITTLGETTLTGTTYFLDFVVFMLLLECNSIFKNDHSLTIQDRAKTAARYEVRYFIVQVQRRWGACEGRHEALRLETITRCRAKLMTTGSVNDKKKRTSIQNSMSGEGGKSARCLWAACKNQHIKLLVRVD